MSESVEGEFKKRREEHYQGFIEKSPNTELYKAYKVGYVAAMAHMPKKNSQPKNL